MRWKVNAKRDNTALINKKTTKLEKRGKKNEQIIKTDCGNVFGICITFN